MKAWRLLSPLINLCGGWISPCVSSCDDKTPFSNNRQENLKKRKRFIIYLTGVGNYMSAGVAEGDRRWSEGEVGEEKRTRTRVLIKSVGLERK